MGNGVRTRDGLPFNFEDGLKVKDVDISGILGGTVLGVKALPTDTSVTKLQDWINLITAQLADIFANGVGGNSETAADRSLLDNSNFIANTKFVQALVAQTILNLVGNAPNSLNTFAEVAAAIGNDPHFSSTVQGLIDGKASIEDVRGTLATFSIAGTNLSAISATFLPTIGQLSDGLLLRVRAYGANTSTTPTFSPDSGNIPFKTIVKGANTELSIGDIAGAGYWMLLQYDAAIDKWILLNPAFALNVKMATNAEAIDGLESNKSISPSSLKAALEALIGAAPAQLNTLKEFADALANDPNFAATMTAALAAKAPLDSAALTGSPTAPTALTGNNSTRIATTAFVAAAIVASVVDATTLVKGVTRLSTISEALDGTSEAVAVTPKGMRAYVENAISSAFTPPNSPTLSGNSTSVVGTNYALNMSATVTQVGATISSFDVSVNGGAAVTVPATSGAATYNWMTTGTIGSTANFSVTAKDSNNKVSGAALFSITLTTITVNTPSITAPANNATNVAVNPSFTTSAYATTGGSDPHLSSSWEIRTAAAGAGTLVISSATSTTNKTTWTPSVTLSPSTVYYVRVRHESTNYGNSAYAENSFTTLAATTPTITAPTAGATGVSITPTITTAAFSGINGSDVHNTSDWEIRTAASGGGTLVGSSTASATNKVSWTVPAATLTTNTTYYVRVRHNGSVSGASAWAERSFTTGRVNAPTITAPASGATGITLTPTITTSAFSTVGTDTHVSSSWEVRTAAGGGGTALVSSLNDTTNKVSYTVNGGILAASTTYYIRVRHTGTIFGATAWVESSFTTGSASVPTISSPAPSSTGVALSPSFTSSAYSAGDTHGSSDWELRTAAGGAGTLLASVTASTTNKTTWTPSVTLSQNTTYYVRVRYFGSTFGYSAWGEASFTTGYVSAPSFTSPTNGETNRAQVSTASLAAFASNGVVTHSSTDWQVRTAAGGGGTVTFSATADTVNKTSISLPASANPTGGTTYYIRARFNTSSMGTTNWTEVSYTTGFVTTPTISAPASGATNVSTTPTYTTSAFNASTTQTHVSTDWELRTAAGGAGTLLTSLSASTTSKLSWTPSYTLSNSTTYYIRARHTGNTFGTSNWAESSFTTAAQLTVPNVTGSGFIPKGGTHVISMSAVPVAPATAISSFFLTIPGVISALEVPVQSNPPTVGMYMEDDTGLTEVTAFTTRAAVTSTGTNKAIYVFQAINKGITPTLTDNKGNTYTLAAGPAQRPNVDNIGADYRLWVCENYVGGSNHTWTSTCVSGTNPTTGSVSGHSLTIVEVLNTSGVDVAPAFVYDTTSPYSATINTVTPNSLVLAMNSSSVVSYGATFTPLIVDDYNDPNDYWSTNAAYRINTTAGTATVTINPDTSADFQIVMLALKPTSNNLTTYTMSTAQTNGMTLANTVGITATYRDNAATNSGASSAYNATVGQVNTAVITAPTNGATGISVTPTLATQAFASTNSLDTHDSTSWEIRTAASGGGTLVWSSAADAVNKTSITVPSATLSNNTTYYLRVKQHGLAFAGSELWAEVSFTTLAAAFVTTPSLTSPTAAQTGYKGPLTSSAFAVTNGTDTHLSSDWQIASDSGFVTVVASVSASTTSKVSWAPTGLVGGTVYHARVRHRGNTYGASSWSATVSFTWIATNKPTISSPTAGATGVSMTPTLTSSAFSSTGTDTHSSTEWQIGTSGAFTTIVTSSTSGNLTSWSPTGLAASTTYYARVRYTGATGQVSAWSDTVNFTTTSPAGVTWTEVNFGGGGMLDAVNGNGLYLTAGYTTAGSLTAGSLWSSTDAVTWTQRTLTNAGFQTSLIYNGSIYVTAGYSSAGSDASGYIATSTDGITWTERTFPAGGIWDIEWDGAQFITTGFGANGSDGGYICTSPNGTTWTTRGVQGPVSANWGRGLAYSPSLDLIVMCGEQSDTDATYPGGGYIATSPDGITWTQRFGATGMIDSVAWSPTLGLFVAVGAVSGSAAYAGSAAQSCSVWWSSNGISWTAGTITGTGHGAMIDVEWTGSQFVAVGFSSAGANTAGSVMTSADGKAWTVRLITSGRLRGVSGTGTKLVAAGYSTAGSTGAGRVYTS